MSGDKKSNTPGWLSVYSSDPAAPVRTLEEVAAVLGVSRARAGQLELSAFERVRKCWRLIDDGMDVDTAVELCAAPKSRARLEARLAQAKRYLRELEILYG